MATRRCIGSAKFEIEAHEAPTTDFPAQPSQKDGLGRMCKTHWKQYVTALRTAAVARKGEDGGVATEAAPTEPQVSRQQRRAMAQAAGKVPTADGSVPGKAPGESPSVTMRRRRLEAKVEAVGVGSDEGQRILEAAGEANQRRRDRDPVHVASDGGGLSFD